MKVGSGWGIGVSIGVGVGVSVGVGVGVKHKLGLSEQTTRAGEFSMATAATSPSGFSLLIL